MDGIEFGPARVSDRRGIRVVSSRDRVWDGEGGFLAGGLVPDARTTGEVVVVAVVVQS